MSLQAKCMRMFCSVPAGGMPGDFLQCHCRRNARPCRRNARRSSAMSLQAECPMIFCSVPAGGMHADFLQGPCRRSARRFFAMSMQVERTDLQAECQTIFCNVLDVRVQFGYILMSFWLDFLSKRAPYIRVRSHQLFEETSSKHSV